MIIKGELCLNQKDEYTMFSGGRLVNLTEYLNLLLMQDVHMTVSSMYNKEIIFDLKGRLFKNKTQPKYYLYHIGTYNIDEVLWNLVGRKIEIQVKNISKY